MKKHYLKITFILTLSLAFLTSGCNLFNSKNKDNSSSSFDENFDQNDTSDENYEEASESFSSEDNEYNEEDDELSDNKKDDKDDKKDKNHKNNKKDKYNKNDDDNNDEYVPSNKPSKSPSYSIISDSSLSTQWDIIDSVVSAAQDYYTENFNKTRLITKDGFLYNYAASEKIDANLLVAEGYLSSQYINKDCDVLLLNADQMKKYDTLNIKESESGLTVFTALKHPKENIYLIATNKSAGGYLTASQYTALLNEYYQNHGSYGTLFGGTDEYNRIISFINMYESKYENYNVRSIIRDNKYAFVVLSPESNTADVKQYVLKKTGSIWEVVMSGLESEPRISVAVNKELPDFNLNMLPTYVITDYKNSLNSYNQQIRDILVQNNYISTFEDIKYISSVKGFGYILLKNEEKYIAIEENGQWTFTKCLSSSEAIKKMTEIKKNAPTFIVLDS